MTSKQQEKLSRLIDNFQNNETVFIKGLEFYILEINTFGLHEDVNISLRLKNEYEKPERSISDFETAELINELQGRIDNIKDDMDRYYD